MLIGPFQPQLLLSSIAFISNLKEMGEPVASMQEMSACPAEHMLRSRSAPVVLFLHKGLCGTDSGKIQSCLCDGKQSISGALGVKPALLSYAET